MRIRNKLAVAAVSGGVFAGGVVTAAPASADTISQVGCAHYDLVIWGARGIPYCFAGSGLLYLHYQITGVTGANWLPDAGCYSVETQPGDAWQGCYFDYARPFPNATIDAVEI